MEKRTRWRLELTFLHENRGGRQSPVVLSRPYAYRPHLVVEREVNQSLQPHPSEEYLGIDFIGPLGQFPIERVFEADVVTTYPNVSYEGLKVGASITVREGARIVAQGRVVAELDSDGSLDPPSVR